MLHKVGYFLHPNSFTPVALVSTRINLRRSASYVVTPLPSPYGDSSKGNKLLCVSRKLLAYLNEMARMTNESPIISSFADEFNEQIKYLYLNTDIVTKWSKTT